jgi:hypothetical protein
MGLKIAVAMAVMHDVETTAQHLSSLVNCYPGIRIHCTVPREYDGCSELLNKLQSVSDTFTFHILRNNPVYVELCNQGISVLSKEGYRSILLCHSGIYITEQSTLYDLERTARNSRAAVTGPRIVSGDGSNCNPLLSSRPSPSAARLFKVRYSGPLSLLPVPDKKGLPMPAAGTGKMISHDVPDEVYAMSCDCVLLSPLYLDILDSISLHPVPLYESLLLAEMAVRSYLHSWYEPAAQVILESPRPPVNNISASISAGVTTWYREYYAVVNRMQSSLKKYSKN